MSRSKLFDEMPSHHVRITYNKLLKVYWYFVDGKRVSEEFYYNMGGYAENLIEYSETDTHYRAGGFLYKMA